MYETEIGLVKDFLNNKSTGLHYERIITPDGPMNRLLSSKLKTKGEERPATMVGTRDKKYMPFELS